MRTVDVAVVGAGSAGLAAFDEARRRTSGVLLIHDAPEGTTCARAGCMPSKALIQIAADFERRGIFAGQGISGAGALRIDARKVLRRVRALRDGFTAGPLERVAALGRRALAGRARFLEPGVLRVGMVEIRAKSVVVAVGSRPVVPPRWEALRPRLLTTDELFELETLPASLAVLGLGGVGIELAQALARLGVRTAGVERTPFLGGLTDPAVNRRLAELLGAELHLWRGNKGEVELRSGRLRVRAGARSAAFEKILVCLGRRPDVEGLGLENLGVPLSESGMPAFDPETMRVGKLPVFLAGDASGDRPSLHEALDAGRIAGFNAAAARSKHFKRFVRLSVAFCDPNAAVVGKSWKELKGRKISVGEFDFKRQGRALIQSRSGGLLRIYGDPRDGRLLGAELAAPSGEHLAQHLALALSRGLTARQALEAPFYHPTLEEGLRDAVRGLARRAA